MKQPSESTTGITDRTLWRDELALVMIAAWCGTTPEKLPPEMRAHTCEHTARSWTRVAEAARKHILKELSHEEHTDPPSLAIDHRLCNDPSTAL